MDVQPLREQLAKLLDWRDSHAGWRQALAGIPFAAQGKRPRGGHSPWELLEHMRLAQWDILEFCRNPKHVSPDWPSGYWPARPKPADSAAWAKSVRGFTRDKRALQQLALDPGTDLFALLPHGSGQTILREVLLAADHNAYHIGQLVLVRKLLGIWPD